MEALSESDAARKLKSGKLFPVSIKAATSHRKRRIPEEHVIRFFFDLSDLIAAGLPLDRTLSLISSNQTHKRFQRVVQELFRKRAGRKRSVGGHESLPGRIRRPFGPHDTGR